MRMGFNDLVFVVPGILGSRLVRRSSGAVVWDLSLHRLAGVIAARDFALSGVPEELEDEDIVATELFRSQWIPGFFGVDDYASLLGALRAEVPSGQVRVFPYDWRQSNARSARRLAQVVQEALDTWRKGPGRAKAKAWFVCHSMGGLVVRYYTQALGGAADTAGVITLGTPHIGSVKALTALANGLSIGRLVDLTALVRGFPSVYELLPTFPVLRETDANGLRAARLRDFFGTAQPSGGAPLRAPPGALAALNAGRVRAAQAFHAAIAPRDDAPPPFRQYAVFNRRQKTAGSVAIENGRLVDYPTHLYQGDDGWVEADDRGDGTVPSFSCLPPESTDSASALSAIEKHVMLPGSSNVHLQLHNWLHPLDPRAMRDGAKPDDAIALSVPETCRSDEALVIRSSSKSPAVGELVITTADGTRPGLRKTIPVTWPGGDEEVERRVEPLAPGVYRVGVDRDATNKPIDLFDWVLVTPA